MRFLIGNLSRCAGNNHVHIPITINNVTRTLTINQEDLQRDFDDREEVKEAIISRIRSAIKEANASTANQIRTALENKEFQL